MFGRQQEEQEDYRSGRHQNEGQERRGQQDGYYNSNENYSNNQPSSGGFQDTRHQEQSYGQGPPGGYNEDVSGAMQHAQQHAGDSGDDGIFSSVLGFLGQNKQNIASQDVNEQHAVQAHQQFFGGGGNQNQQADSSSMGAAAAMQALKMFTGGESGNSSSGNSQNAFIGIAMAQASKLFDQQSSQGNATGSKESAVQQAGEMALKMYLKSQGSSGGSSGLLGLASKFL